MSRLVHAAKHYGCPKKRYKFEMHIHRVVLTSEKRKLFTRVLWSRGKKKHKSKHNKPRFKTKWCEGVENYNIDESIFDEATIYFTSNTNQIQSKQTKITIQIRERIDGKDVKFAKIALDLSKYVDLSSPHRVFYQRLNYEKARKKAQLIFTIKSMEIMSDGSVSDYTDNDDDDDESHSNYTDYNTDDDESVLSVATLNTIHNANANKSVIKTPKTPKTPKTHKYPSPLLNSTSKSPKTPNIPAIHSNISGNKLKTRYFDKQKNKNSTNKEKSPSPESNSNASNVSNITITRRNDRSGSHSHSHSHSHTHSGHGHEKFVRASQFQFNGKETAKHRVQSSGSHEPDMIPQTPTTISSSTSDIDVRELQRKLKLYEDKHKKYKYKYAKLCKKVEEQEIEARCQQDQICRLKRVDEEVKDQYHTMAKYKKKIKSLTKEREGLKKTLQKRNHTIIVLNKENSRLKKQIIGLQTLESVQFNSDNEYDDNITEFNNSDNEQSDEMKENDINDNGVVGKSNGVYILTVKKKDKNMNGKDVIDTNKPSDNDNDNTNMNKLLNGKDEVSTTNNTPRTSGNMHIQRENRIKRHSLHIRHSDEMTSDLIDKLNSANIIDETNEMKDTNDGYIIGEKETVIVTIVSDDTDENNNNENNNHNKPSQQIIKLVENKQKELNNISIENTNKNIVSDFKNQWMLAETEKLNYKKLYEKEKSRVNHYKSKTSSAYKKYEKSEMELSITKHNFEELQQKYEVMEHAYKKLKQDLNKMMNRYEKLEIEYEKIQNTLSDNNLTLSDNSFTDNTNNNDSV